MRLEKKKKGEDKEEQKSKDRVYFRHYGDRPNGASRKSELGKTRCRYDIADNCEVLQGGETWKADRKGSLCTRLSLSSVARVVPRISKASTWLLLWPMTAKLDRWKRMILFLDLNPNISDFWAIGRIYYYDALHNIYY